MLNVKNNRHRAERYQLIYREHMHMLLLGIGAVFHFTNWLDRAPPLFLNPLQNPVQARGPPHLKRHLSNFVSILSIIQNIIQQF